MQVQFGAAKVPKYATRESGDTLELIERPHGGISAVLVDGQSSGRAAKIISNIVARKAISLVGEGVRDGAVARAAHDYLRTHRAGQVSAELQIASVDLASGTLVLSRNTRCPAIVVQDGDLTILDAPCEPIGIHPYTKPVITELPLRPGTYALLYTDGLTIAEQRAGQTLDLPGRLLRAAREQVGAQALADEILEAALQAESDRPSDDVSVLVVAVLPTEPPHRARRYSLSLPIELPLREG